MAARLGTGRSRDMPALALTAYTQREDRERALAAGFTAHLGKPVTPDALITMVATLAGFPGQPA
jgi:CheY-like chemotaxis protein